MEVRVHKSVSEIDRAKWDSVAGKGRLLCSHRYLEVLERSRVNGGNCHYVVVYDGDDIMAHAPAYFIREELDIFARGALKDMIRQARRKWKDFFILKSLECGPPIALGNVISFKDGIDRAQALDLICRGIEGLAKDLGGKFILFRDFYEKDKELCAVLKGRGYSNIHNLPQAEIKIKWKSFNEYLDSMRSNYRCKIVKSMEKCAKAGISMHTIKGLSPENISELKKLYDNVYDNAKEVKRDRLSESFFENIGKYLTEDTIIVSAVKDGKLIGYMLSLISGKTLITVFPGLDYECNRECFVYFNLFYKCIELAIEMGMSDVDMGITTLNPKRDMGSNIVPLNMYMKHSNPLLNKVIPLLFDMITPPDTTAPRDVFK